MERIPMTPAGAKLLEATLDQLKSKDRPKVIEAIAEARAHGDLKENAEYHAAREQQALLEARISELEAKIPLIQVVDISKIPNEGKIIFGATVTLVNCDTDEEVKYQIVGEEEADMTHHRISVTSPVARGLIGKYEGDEVDIVTPSGTIAYEIINVCYGSSQQS